MYHAWEKQCPSLAHSQIQWLFVEFGRGGNRFIMYCQIQFSRVHMYMFSHLIPLPREEDIPILQVRKLRLRKVKWHFQRQVANEN